MNSAVVVAFAAVLAVASAGFAHPAAYGYGYGAPLAVSHSSYSGIVRGAPLYGGYGYSGAHSLVRIARGLYSGHHAAPLTTYSAAPVAYAAHAAPLAYAASPLAYSAHAAPLAYAGHAAPLAYAGHAAPLAYSSSALLSRSYHVNPLTYGGVAHVRVARGIHSGYHAAPVATYAAAPALTYATSPLAYSVPAVRSVGYGYSTSVAHAAPLAYAAHAAPLAYAAHTAPLAYAAAPALRSYGYGIHGAQVLLK